jgi:hypothetical protein
MPVNTFLDVSQMPARTQDQQTFDNLMGAFMQKLPTFGAEVNALAAALNAIAAGGAYAIPYVFDTTTADADPGNGKLRLDSATQTSATTVRLDLLSNGLGDVTSILDRFDASTSAVKGSIRMVKQGDVTKWLTFDITARATATGYRNITLTNGVGSSAAPFANGDAVMLFFQRNGDKGDTGAVASFPILYVREEQPSGTASSSSGTFGVTQCPLNTVKVNEISGASLASNQVTLPAGTYEYEGSTVAYGSALTHKAMLYNVTDLVYTDYGTSSSSNSTASDTSRAFLRGKMTLTSPKVFQLRRYNTGSSAGPAQPASAAATEVYFEILFKKVA